MSYKIVILGSTGTIGKRSIEVIQHLANKHTIIGLVAGKNTKLLIQQAKQTKARYACINQYEHLSTLQDSLPSNCNVLYGEKGMIEMVSNPEVDFVLCGIVGTAGLTPVLKAIRLGKTVAFANKEILVMAGKIIRQEAKKYKAKILPIDSEHSAIFQCLLGHKKKDVNQLILSCSGGPFRNFTYGQLQDVTLEQTLKHPTWKMGNKITIDSATLMNKALEIIEAHWLFDLPTKKINALLHPQSIIHSMVEYIDGSTIAQLGVTDMAIPIQYAITYPNHCKGLTNTRMNWTINHKLEFYPVDHKTFCSISLAKQALETNPLAPVVLNAANEIAVDAFYHNKIKFVQIWDVIKKSLDKIQLSSKIDLETILDIDAKTRLYAKKITTK